MRRLSRAATLILLCALGASACGGGSDDSDATVVTLPDDEALIAVTDTQDAGEQVDVERVRLPSGGGYVAVYDYSNDAPGRLLGASGILSEGDHEDVEVDLTEASQPGAQAFVMLHGEASGNAELDYPGPDEPLDVDGAVLTVVITFE